MPRNPKGEMSLGEIRNLAKQHNKLSTITGIETRTRKSLLEEIVKMGYRVDHEKKAIIRNTKIINKRAGLVQSKKGQPKKQERTKMKERRKEFLKKTKDQPKYTDEI
tara:strand:- start:518 stop:838 length:321 start_codon:yes stop_codon:yes gene_type:complete